MDVTHATAPRPPVRSYKQRRGRIGPTRAAAIARLLPRYGLDVDGPPLDLVAVFAGRPVVCEIGCGHGEATVAAAAADPSGGVLAVDVHLPGLGSLLQAVEAGGLDNVRVVHGDAVALLTRRIPPASLGGVRVFFPDPWPKARQQKRRLLTPAVLSLLADRCRPGALLHVVTDDAGYADAVAVALAMEPRWVDDVAAADAPPRRATRYEAAALRAGRATHELLRRRGGAGRA